MAAPAAFSRKSMAYLVNGWRLFRRQPLLKVAFVSLFALGCVLGLWRLFLDGFYLLDKFGGLAGLIMSRLFSMFYLGMGLMLVMSGIVTAYATMYRSDEMPFLVARPIPLPVILTYKFLESAYFSSWAFLFVIVPFAGAYAMHQRLGPAFGLWTALFSIPFLVVCAGIGTLLLMLLARWWPRGLTLRRMALPALLLGGWWLWRLSLLKDAADDGGTFALSALLPGVQLAANRLLPSTWVAEGVLAMARQDWTRGAIYLGAITTTALAVTALVEWVGTHVFLPAWEHIQEGGGSSARGAVWLRRLERRLGFIPSDLRTLMMKDVRTFLRDPMQWSQALVFFGLLGLYFANLRRFDYHASDITWRTLICFLNVFSVSAVLCSLGARFVYPQLSLEGQGFWLLGLAPTSMRRILLAKFILALAATGAVSLFLIGLSSHMLGVDRPLLLASLGLTAAVALAISGLSTGLGAVFMDLRQRNPAAIVGGFGGTVNLVLSLGFMLAVIIPVGTLFYLRNRGLLPTGGFPRLSALAFAWCVALTALAVVAPLAAGLRALKHRDY